MVNKARMNGELPRSPVRNWRGEIMPRGVIMIVAIKVLENVMPLWPSVSVKELKLVK